MSKTWEGIPIKLSGLGRGGGREQGNSQKNPNTLEHSGYKHCLKFSHFPLKEIQSKMSISDYQECESGRVWRDRVRELCKCVIKFKSYYRKTLNVICSEDA